MSAWMITDDHADLLATAAMQIADGGNDGQEIGQAVLQENVHSLSARYSDTSNQEQVDNYRFRAWPGELAPGMVNAAARCADYQCCEHGEAWANSASGQLVARLIEATGGRHVELDPWPWGIDFRHRAAAEAGQPRIAFEFFEHINRGARRALLIDPFSREVHEGWQVPGLEGLYASIGCRAVDIIAMGRDPEGRPVDLILDDEGRLKPDQACFRLGDHLIAGRALLMSHGADGETAACGLPIQQVMQLLQWCAPGTDYDPPAPVVIGFSSFDAARAAGLI